MPRITEWKNVPCELNVPVYRSDAGNFAGDDRWARDDESPVPASIAAFLNEFAFIDDAELTIHFKSTGYCDPGNYACRIEDAEPPDYQEERVITAATLHRPGQTLCRKLPESLNSDLESWLQSEIDQMEIEHDLTPPAAAA